ncbi:hypothetical protein [Desulfovibrio sp. JC010]|uniref:hypothetical protein n=1 Tax=Desulfovibrio sp. JC010 TaxID=2593641 RepID=UPI0013D793AA|nr:hypothetical protein [Desulfovibrio sp. JC010]NDV27525.1 hypothetical protein [Desulfovibrio sp. JC010]
MSKRKKFLKKKMQDYVDRTAPLRNLHCELFPEEYDHVYDSIADAQDRARGVSPMRQEYIDKVNARRRKVGVKPYELKDNSPEIDVLNMESEVMINSWEYCQKVLNGEIEKGVKCNAI